MLSVPAKWLAEIDCLPTHPPSLGLETYAFDARVRVFYLCSVMCTEGWVVGLVACWFKHLRVCAGCLLFWYMMHAGPLLSHLVSVCTAQVPHKHLYVSKWSLIWLHVCMCCTLMHMVLCIQHMDMI